MTDRPIVRILIEGSYNPITLVQVWLGGQWEDQKYEIQRPPYEECGCPEDCFNGYTDNGQEYCDCGHEYNP